MPSDRLIETALGQVNHYRRQPFIPDVGRSGRRSNHLGPFPADIPVIHDDFTVHQTHNRLLPFQVQHRNVGVRSRSKMALVGQPCFFQGEETIARAILRQIIQLSGKTAKQSNPHNK